ncbi:MAG: HAD-IA family hydrolase [Planctomycetes bacterium]|nr:HAD-IA family hydrolase [Planctomycetota bacterium]
MAAKKQLALVTFDIDDTLYSTTDFVRLARENSLKAMLAAGLKVDLERARIELEEVVHEFTSNDERHFDRLLQRLPPECLEDCNPAVVIASGVAAYHDTVFNHLTPYEDVVEGIRRLHQLKYNMGVITQGWTVKQAEKLVRLRVLPYFNKKALFLSDQLGMSKANSKFFQRSAATLGLPNERCMHVGDRPDRDIEPANKAGWLTVLNKRSGRYHERVCETPPAYIVHNFWDLVEILEKEFEPA